MYKELTSVAKTLLSVGKAIFEHLKHAELERQQLALLTALFCFVGLVDSGRQLLNLVGPEPLEKLRSLSVEELRDFNAVVQRHLSLQLARLGKLHGIVQDQQVIELFDISLRHEITEAIGEKENGLFSVGARLLYYLKFIGPSHESSDPADLAQTAELISALYPEIERGIIAVPEAIRAIDELDNAAAKYREVLHLIIPAERLIELSRKASELAIVQV